jgi:type I restriction enzyme S subunit
MSEWKQMQWRDLVILEYGKGIRGYQDGNGPYRVFGTNGPIGWHDEPLCKEETVIIGRKGAYRGVRYSREPCFVIDTAFYLKPQTEFDMKWAYYELLTHDINSMDSGSAIPSTTRDSFYSLPVLVPSLPEQRAISHILGTLDDKIELNRRMNETLEAMARAIFKSWFVDFDPVRAKAEGRDTGLPEKIADLFPDSFEETELGEVPRGWEVKTIGDLVELAYGKALKEEIRRRGKIPVFGSNGQVGWHDEKLAIGPGIIVGRKGNPGIITWAPTDFFAIDTTFYVVPKKECQNLYFLYYMLKTHELGSLGADSAVPGLNRNLAYMSKQTMSSIALLDLFDSMVQPLFQRIYEADTESRTLAELRDTLLPKLISGELRVKDGKIIAEVE